MPEISLFFDREDERSLVEFLLARGAWLVGDMQSSPQCVEIRDLDAYIAARANQRLFFVMFDAYSECPFDLYLIPGGYYEGKYSIRQRVGGPTIDLLTSVQYHKDGDEWVSGGGVSYYPTYENTVTGEMEKPPEALVKQYKQILSHLKKNCKLIKGQSGRKYLIGPHTYQRLKEGTLRLWVKGLEVD